MHSTDTSFFDVVLNICRRTAVYQYGSVSAAKNLSKQGWYSVKPACYPEKYDKHSKKVGPKI